MSNLKTVAEMLERARTLNEQQVAANLSEVIAVSLASVNLPTVLQEDATGMVTEITDLVTNAKAISTKAQFVKAKAAKLSKALMAEIERIQMEIASETDIDSPAVTEKSAQLEKLSDLMYVMNQIGWRMEDAAYSLSFQKRIDGLDKLLTA